MAIPRGSPVIAVIAGLVIGGGIIGYFSWRKHSPTPAVAEASAAASPASSNTTSSPTVNVAPVPAPVKVPAREAIAPEPIAADLERSLKRARLWSTVTVIGDHVDVRSGSCGDAQMKSALDVATSSFKAAGLTKLRCIEQSGGVVFSRDL